jgi:hypothetical protein
VTSLLVIAAALLSLAGAAPIALGTWRGRDNPQVMSWCIWAALPLAGGLAMVRGSHMLPAVNVLAVAVSCALVAVLALRVPAARRDPPPRLRLWPGGLQPRLDLLCLPGAVAGLVLIVAVRSPVPAVLVTVATDALAFPPTYGHIWSSPRKEPWLSYALFSAGGAVSLLAADWSTAAGWVYPVYLCAGDGIAALLIIARRRAVLERPFSAPLPPDDGLCWYERPEWYAALRFSARLPAVEHASPATWLCIIHRQGWCRDCARFPRPWLRGKIV